MYIPREKPNRLTNDEMCHPKGHPSYCHPERSFAKRYEVKEP